mgnify:CR=1 FL=1
MAIQDTSLEKRLNELEASAVDTEEAEVLSQVPVEIGRASCRERV